MVSECAQMLDLADKAFKAAIKNMFKELKETMFKQLKEREIKETIPFTITSKRIKYLGKNPPKEAKHLYSKKL